MESKSEKASDEDDHYDLGSYSRTITTSSEKAKTWFNRGLIWSYGFNHEEAVHCFQHAAAEDESCAMAYWGIAYALGPNYNKPWDFFDDSELQTVAERTHEAVERAEAAVSKEHSVERALIEALRFRYQKSRADTDDCAIWNKEYADAMQKAYSEFGDDLDVATLYADAMMNLTPWQLWDIKTGEPASVAKTMEIKSVLDRALAQEGGLEHPGLLHLYIHLMEMSPTPESALPLADRLRGLVPDAGHLQHMPSHLDILCGDYQKAIRSNADANTADEKYVKRAGPLNFYTLYRLHDYHFKQYAAMFAGQSSVAFDTVEKIGQSLSDELLRRKSPPMADWLEGFLGMRVHALVRFGKWQEIIGLQLPQDAELHCVTTAMMLYAKCIAWANVGELDAARNQRALFQVAVVRVPASRTIFNNTCQDILAVAEAMLNGELEYRLGNVEEGFSWLRKAIELDDNLPYDEPWGWMQPARHAYGALLLEQGRVEEAAAVYRADLGFDDTLPRQLRHLNNVWALRGYHECLIRLGKQSEADTLKPQLDLALAGADIEIPSSCFCRRSEQDTT